MAASVTNPNNRPVIVADLGATGIAIAIDYTSYYDRIATALETVATNSTAIKNSLDTISMQTVAIATRQQTLAATSERVASSVEYFKNYGLVTRSLMEELSSYTMSKTILNDGVSLKDAVKSGRDLQKAVREAVTPQYLNPLSNDNSGIMPLSIEPMAFDAISDITIPDPIKALSISGVWNSSQRYLKDQLVSYKNEIWACVRDSSNVVPSDDPSYWMQTNSDDIANIRAAPILTKIADDIYSITPAAGEIVYDSISKEKLIGKVGGGTLPFTDDTINQTAGPPRAIYMGVWSGKKAYKKGNTVTDKKGKHWVASNTSAPVGVTPSENTGWYETKKIDELLKGTPELVSDTDMPKFKGPWSDIANYAKNDVVSNNDKYWLAKKNTPGPIPPLSNDWWETKDIDGFPVQIDPLPIYEVTPSDLIVDEGSTVTFTVTGSNIKDGTYYWTTESIGIDLDLNSGLPVTLRDGTDINLSVANNSLAIPLRNNTIDNLSINNNLLSIVVHGANDSFPIILRNGFSVKVDVINDNLGITLRNDNNLNARIINGKLPITLHNSGNSIPVRLIDGSSITKVSIRELGNGVGATLSITLRDSSIVNLNINNNLLPVRLLNNSIINVTIIDNQIPVQKFDIGLTYYVNINGMSGNMGPGIPVTLRNGINMKVGITNNRLSITLRNGDIIDLIINDGNSIINVDIINGGNFGNSFGTFDIIDNLGSFTVMPTADLTTEGNEKFIVSIRSNGTSGVLLASSKAVTTINDTSLTPIPPHTTWNASVYYLKEEIVEFCGLFYKAKVNTFRTIPSRSPNDWERRYY